MINLGYQISVHALKVGEGAVNGKSEQLFTY